MAACPEPPKLWLLVQLPTVEPWEGMARVGLFLPEDIPGHVAHILPRSYVIQCLMPFQAHDCAVCRIYNSPFPRLWAQP